MPSGMRSEMAMCTCGLDSPDSAAFGMCTAIWKGLSPASLRVISRAREMISSLERKLGSDTVIWRSATPLTRSYRSAARQKSSGVSAHEGILPWSVQTRSARSAWRP